MNSRHGCRVLSYHRVLPPELLSEQITQQSLLVSTEAFRRQMLYAQKKYQLLSADEMVSILESGKGFQRPSCVITFDDGWRDNYLYAFPILKEMNIPAIIFVTVNHVETGQDFWPERLARLVFSLVPRANNAAVMEQLLPLNQASLLTKEPVEYANLATIALKSRPVAEIDRLLGELEQKSVSRRLSIRTERSICYWHELKEMLQSSLLTIGSHTLSHAILTNEDATRCKEEVFLSKSILERKLDVAVDHFAYPNGSFNEAVEVMVKKAGYRSAFTCVKGINTAMISPYRIKRIHMIEAYGSNRFSDVFLSFKLSGVSRRLEKLRDSLLKQSY